MRWRDRIGGSIMDWMVVSFVRENIFRRGLEVLNDFGKRGCRNIEQRHIKMGLGFNTTHFGLPG